MFHLLMRCGDARHRCAVSTRSGGPSRFIAKPSPKPLASALSNLDYSFLAPFDVFPPPTAWRHRIGLVALIHLTELTVYQKGKQRLSRLRSRKNFGSFARTESSQVPPFSAKVRIDQGLALDCFVAT